MELEAGTPSTPGQRNEQRVSCDGRSICACSNSCSFEKVLSEQDVEVYVRCIEANMPDLYTKCVRLDGAARQAFEEGLKAYGGNSKFQQWRDAQREAVTTDQSRALNLLAQAAAQRQDPPRGEYAGADADVHLVGWVDVTLPDIGTHDCQTQLPLVQVRTGKDGVERQTFADSAPEPKLKLLKHVICNLGVSSFGETLLLRATEQQRRWSADGHITAVCLEHTAMSNESASLFLDRDNLMSLLGSAVKHGLLERQLEQLEWTYRGTGDELGSPDSDQYIRDSFALLCYICPREEALDPKYECLLVYVDCANSHRFTIIMERLLPALQSMFQYLHYQSGVCIDDELRHDLIETWIATVKAYNFRPSPDMLELLKVGGQLHKSGVPSCLQLALARTQSVILRRREQYVESDEVINLAIRTFPLEDVRTACFRGLLYLSLAENAILRNQYSTAMEWVDAIELTVAPAEHLQKTALIWHLLEEKWIAMGRIYRYTAQFEKAEEALRPCLNRRRQSSMTNVHHIVRQLADVYVELREYEQAKTLLDHYLGQLREQGKQSSRPYSRLLLSKVDVDIATGDHKNAQALLDEIDQDFGRKPPTTQTEQLDHVRAEIASMRIAMYGDDWDRVLRRSMEALRLANTYSSFTGTNYYKGYILKLRTTAYLSLAHADIAAAEDCGLEPRNFITGVGTYDLEKAHSSLQAAFQSCASPINRILSATPPSNSGV